MHGTIPDSYMSGDGGTVSIQGIFQPVFQPGRAGVQIGTSQ